MKYATLNTMDHFNSMEEQKKAVDKQDKKGTWKSPKDELKKVHIEFESIQAIKNTRSKLNKD